MTRSELLKRLKSKYSVVAPVWGSDALKTARKAKSLGADMLELRIDDMRGAERAPEAIAELIRKLRRVKLPIIATIRTACEKSAPGGWKPADNERLDIFKSIIRLVDLVDIEASSGKINRDVIKLAHKNNKLVIVSYHNFRTTPSNKLLRNKALKAYKLKADIIKLSVTPQKAQDVGRLMLFCESWKKTPMAAVSMGETGSISRIVGFVYGSCLTYGYVKKANAPGQVSVKELSVCSSIELSAS